MIKLIDYGKPVESSIYSFVDNKLNNIDYEIYINDTNVLIRVFEEDGVIKRRASYDAEYSEKVIDKFELKVEDGIFGSRFDFSDIVIYKYDDSPDMDDVSFKVPTISTVGNSVVNVYVNKNNVAIYHKGMNIVKIYPLNLDGSIDFSNLIEEEIITDFGVMSRTAECITVIYNYPTEIISYELEKHNEFDIECLRDRCNIINAYNKKFMVSYSLDNMVESVKCNNELYSRSEIDILKNSKSENIIITDSIYPSLIMSNYINYKHKFLSAWNHDILKKNDRDEIISFCRNVYAVDRVDDLLEKLRSDPNELIINY